MSQSVIPGPIIPELLWKSRTHRAGKVFYDDKPNDVNRHLLEVRRCDQSYYEYLRGNPIPDNVMQYIRIAGFGGVAECGFHKVDHALITALVERWRPETHTFHLPIGETTVTLEDVQVLWGLQTDGLVVTGTTNIDNQTIVALCQTYLGFNPPESSIKGSTIKITTLVNVLKTPLPIPTTDEHIQQRARVYILIIIGGILFSDLSGNRVSCAYITNLIDLQFCGTLSWGSAVLAYLYRQLCKAADKESHEIGGPTMLLQFWAWEHINAFRPEIVYSNYNFHAPYAAR